MKSKTPELIKPISSIPLFEGVPPEYLAKLAQIASEREYERGQTIFSEGEDGAGFYVALAGSIKIYKVAPDGKEQILHLFGPGDPFGEVPVFEGARFPANATALETARVLFFPRNAFIALLREEPGLALKMLAILSRRLRRFTQLIEDLSLKEVPGRFAAYVLYAGKGIAGDEIDLGMPKAQLASLLGTIPETLSRILGRMNRAGLIASGPGNHIRILDRPELERLAQGEQRLE